MPFFCTRKSGKEIFIYDLVVYKGGEVSLAQEETLQSQGRCRL